MMSGGVACRRPLRVRSDLSKKSVHDHVESVPFFCLAMTAVKRKFRSPCHTGIVVNFGRAGPPHKFPTADQKSFLSCTSRGICDSTIEECNDISHLHSTLKMTVMEDVIEVFPAWIPILTTQDRPRQSAELVTKSIRSKLNPLEAQLVNARNLLDGTTNVFLPRKEEFILDWLLEKLRPDKKQT